MLSADLDIREGAHYNVAIRGIWAHYVASWSDAYELKARRF